MSLLETAPAPDFYGHTIFCDDIRFELDGKLTLVGVYGAGILVVNAAFPVTLPKFCFLITFNQRHKFAQQKLGVRIYLPGDLDEKPSIEADLPALSQPTPEQITDGEYVMVGSNLMLAPFTIEKSGRIKVRILREGVLHRIGTLKVSHISEVRAPSNES